MNHLKGFDIVTRGRPNPDSDGLYDVSGVRLLAAHRNCKVKVKNELYLTVTGWLKTAPLTAIAPGRWDPVSILRACTIADSRVPHDVDLETASRAVNFWMKSRLPALWAPTDYVLTA
jgi:hypothetical protein